MRIGNHRFWTRSSYRLESVQCRRLLMNPFAGGRRVLRCSEEKTGQELDLDASGSVSITSGRLNAPAKRIILGRFTRDGRQLVLAVNVGTEASGSKSSLASERGPMACRRPGQRAQWSRQRPARVRDSDCVFSLPPKASAHSGRAREFGDDQLKSMDRTGSASFEGQNAWPNQPQHTSDWAAT